VPDVFARLTEALAGRYALDRELGEGGMATVYLAEDLRHRRKVAIKVLRPELAAVIGAERFLKEIETTASLQHPHILPLLDSGQAGDTPGLPGPYLYYVMPFIEGESLRDRLARERQLPVTEAVRIATEAASALDYAHRHGVIHRDIKPENILLHDGSAMVADFGIALAASKAGGTRMTETGMSLGTPHYMSPEQAMGEREITARSDVYALGCVTYEMLTGDPPFTGSTAQAIVARVLTESPRPLTPQRRTIPAHVEAAVLAALEKLPADRWGSAAEFAAALEGRGSRTLGTGATAPVAVVPRRRAALGTTAALGFVTLVAVGIAAWGWLRPVPAPPTSRQKVELWHHSLGRFLAPGIERLASQASIAPDGSSIVFVDSVGDGLQLLRKRRGESEPVPIPGTEGAMSPFFSPDGKWIGYVTADGRLRKVPVAGGGSVTLASSSNYGYLGGAWLDDGSIVFVGRDQGMRRVPAEGGEDRAVRSNTGTYRINIATLQPLPGSRGVLYTSCPGNCGIESSVNVFDFAADSGRLLVANAAGAWYFSTGHLLYTDRAGGLYAAGFDPKRLVMTTGVVPVLEDVAPVGFTLSASGDAVYTITGGASALNELMWVSRDGRAERLDSTWRADFEYPALSPDGRTLAVSVRDGSTQLWIRRADGVRQKLSQSGTVNWRPSWTPDGKSLAFVTNMRGTGNQDAYDVFEMPVDGSAPPRLLLHHRYGLWEAELSRDGQWLVTRSDEEGSVGHIRARRLAGDTALIPLVVGTSNSAQVALSPDGRRLAYVSVISGKQEVYVTPFPSASSTHVVSRDGGTEPRWSHSGRELFYRGGNRLMAVDVAPGQTFVAGTPHPLFSLAGYRSARNRQQYDVAPDDRRFLMIREPADAGPGTVVYVENWAAELRAKLSGAAKE
jgi:Tol biopolymer transport system component